MPRCAVGLVEGERTEHANEHRPQRRQRAGPARPTCETFSPSWPLPSGPGQRVLGGSPKRPRDLPLGPCERRCTALMACGLSSDQVELVTFDVGKVRPAGLVSLQVAEPAGA